MTATTERPAGLGRTDRPAKRSGALARSHRRWGVLMAAPALLGFAVFTIGPMIGSFFFSLTDKQIGISPKFVGIDNYSSLYHDPLFWASLRATAYYVVVAVPGTLLVAFAVAQLLRRAGRATPVFRVLYYLPVLVPPVASAVLWLWLFNPDLGLLNEVLAKIGIGKSQWIYSERTAVPSLALVAAWGFGNTALVFLAGLQGVPTDLYEAAECDGANAWQRLRSITLPSVSPVILFNLVTGMIAAFQVFDAAYVMTKGGPNNATFFYVFYLYTKAFTQGYLGAASAMAWVLFLIVLVITVVLFRTARFWVFYAGGDR